ncbi:Meiotic coiled-coil protein 2 [Mycena venus]|uniref:Meiotic coiled-coil protein 2 n=1 Tax=Mycena venus TaxID=2733690 RepID=A0A8H7CTU7_9AGAR|nr:Meiotic coiled-coil protein 2 [Mycena venus]
MLHPSLVLSVPFIHHPTVLLRSWSRSSSLPLRDPTSFVLPLTISIFTDHVPRRALVDSADFDSSFSVNKFLKSKWAALAYHETGWLVMLVRIVSSIILIPTLTRLICLQHAFKNVEEGAKDRIVNELLGQGAAVFSEVGKSQWGLRCFQHVLEHGSEKHLALEHFLTGLLEFATNQALKEGMKETLVQCMCEPAKGARYAMIVDLVHSLTGSQLIVSVLPTADKNQHAALPTASADTSSRCAACKTGSKVIWPL